MELLKILNYIVNSTGDSTWFMWKILNKMVVVGDVIIVTVVVIVVVKHHHHHHLYVSLTLYFKILKKYFFLFYTAQFLIV